MHRHSPLFTQGVTRPPRLPTGMTALDILAEEFADRVGTILDARLQEERARIPLRERPGLTIEEAAQLIGVSRQFLVTYVNSGELPVVKIGPRIRLVRPETLETFLQQHEQPDPQNG